MDSILKGLPRDFDSVIALIQSRLPYITGEEEVEGFILAQELPLRKYNKLDSLSNTFAPTVNLTQASSSRSPEDDSLNLSFDTNVVYSSDSQNSGGCFSYKLSQIVYSSPLELIYNDLWGSALMNSHCNFHYCMSFVDAYSKFTWIYFLKSKYDALTVLKQFKSLVELQFNRKFKAIQKDWGG